MALFTLIPDLHSETLVGGSGAEVTEVMKKTEGFGYNYGSYLTSESLNASESNSLGYFNPSNVVNPINVGDVGLGKIVGDIATA